MSEALGCRVYAADHVTGKRPGPPRNHRPPLRCLPRKSLRQDECNRVFAERYPDIPTPGLADRDFAGFSVRQRELVQRLLLAGRLSLATTARLEDGTELLVTHAGVTVRELDGLGVPADAPARRIAEALEALLARAVDRCRDAWSVGEAAPLDLAPVGVSGTTGQEGGGLLYHRPANPDRPDIRDPALGVGRGAPPPLRPAPPAPGLGPGCRTHAPPPAAPGIRRLAGRRRRRRPTGYAPHPGRGRRQRPLPPRHDPPAPRRRGPLPGGRRGPSRGSGGVPGPGSGGARSTGGAVPPEHGQRRSGARVACPPATRGHSGEGRSGPDERRGHRSVKRPGGAPADQDSTGSGSAGRPRRSQAVRSPRTGPSERPLSVRKMARRALLPRK